MSMERDRDQGKRNTSAPRELVKVQCTVRQADDGAIRWTIVDAGAPPAAMSVRWASYDWLGSGQV